MSRRWGLIFVSTLLLSALVRGEGRLIFPRLETESAGFAGLCLFNPSGAKIEVRLTAYDRHGEIVQGPGLRNPVTVSLGSATQMARVQAEWFGNGPALDAAAWVEAKSESPDLTGFFLLLNRGVTRLDGAGTPVPARELVFHGVSLVAELGSEITLVNPGPVFAAVQLTLMRSAGSLHRTLQVPPYGAYRAWAAEIFPGGESVEPGVLTVSSQTPLAGFQTTAGGGEVWAAAAVPLAAASATLDFPQLAVCPPYRSTLHLANHGTSAQTVTLSAFRPDGRLYGGDSVRGNPVHIDLAPGTALSADLEELFGFTGQLKTGWLRVAGSQPALTGMLVYSIPEEGAVAAVPAAGPPRTHASFSHIATSLGYFTGLALLNTAQMAANFRLVATDAEGSVVGFHRGFLEPGERQSRLVEEFIPEAAGMAGGALWMASDVPLTATSLFGRLQSPGSAAVLANIPAQAAGVSGSAPGPDPGGILPVLVQVAPGASQLFAGPGSAASGVASAVGAGTLGVGGRSSGPVWRVNGIPFGDERVGTVSTGGMYRAPSMPPGGPVTLSVEWDVEGRTFRAAATVDVGAPVPSGESASLLTRSETAAGWYRSVDVGTGSRILRSDGGLVADLSGQQVRGLEAWHALDDKEYLLAATSAGRLLRIDPLTGLVTTLLDGLSQPGRLALDPLTGNLLIAEAAFLSSFPAFALNHGLNGFNFPDRRRVVRVSGLAPAQAAVDPCSGHIYLVEAAAGKLHLWDRVTGRREVVLEGLRQPVALKAVFRADGGCPSGPSLLIAESAAGVLSAYSPAGGSRHQLAEVAGIRDVELIAGGSSGSTQLLLAANTAARMDAASWVATPPPIPAGVFGRLRREVAHVGPVAPDVLAITVLSGARNGARQVPYEPQPGDTVSSSSAHDSVWLVRGGRVVGSLVGPERQVFYPFDELEGIPELLAGDETRARLGSPKSYLVRSEVGSADSVPAHPLEVHLRIRPWDLVQTGIWSFAWPLEYVLFIRLGAPLSPGSTHRILFDEGFLPEIVYRHEPDQVRSEAVQASQVGFRPDDPAKWAYVSAWLGSGGGLTGWEGAGFRVLDEYGRPAYSGQLHLSKAGVDRTEDPYGKNYSGFDVFRGDFTALDKPGTYRFCLDGTGCSFPFTIGGDGWRNPFRVSARGLYHQRSGISIGPPFTRFERPRAFHPDDGVRIHASTAALVDSGNGLDADGNRDGNFGDLVAGRTGEVVADSWGGYFDAGDWDRRIQHLESSRLLLELALAFPGEIHDGDLNLPESGNGIPDLVDEALWGLDVYRRMQTPQGGIRGGIESAEHPRFGEASWQESLPVMAYAPDIWSSYAYAGVAARAAFWLQPRSSGLAAVYEQSSVRAMQWAEANYPGWLASRPIQPADPQAVKDAVNEVRDARNLAALELFRLTGLEQWHEIFLSTTQFHDPAADLFVWRSHSQRDAAFLYCLLPLGRADRQVQENARNAILREAAESVRQSRRTGFNWTKYHSWEPVGFGKLSTPQAVTLVRAHQLTGDRELLEATVASCLTGLGANPLNLSYTTGLGFQNPRNPLVVDQRRSLQEPPPGITVYGPFDMELYGPGHWAINLLSGRLTPSRDRWPTASSYFDVFLFPETNEFTTHQTLAPAAYVFGYLSLRR